MIDDVFPDKTNPTISDDEWLDYCIGTWSLNSVESVKTLFREPYLAAKKNNADYIIIKIEHVERLNSYLKRFEHVYGWLWDFWRKIKGFKN